MLIDRWECRGNETLKSQSNRTKARILIVDDHPIVRDGLKYALQRVSDLTICGDAATIGEALLLIERTEPNLVIVDLRLTDGDGLDLIKDIKNRYPSVWTLVLSLKTEPLYAERAIRGGARGYVTKETVSQDIVRAIRAVLAGEYFVSESIAGQIIHSNVNVDMKSNRAGMMSQLTDRELQVLERTGAGMSASAIAKDLHLNVKTIHSHRRNLMRKLKIASVSQLFHFVMSTDLAS